MKTTHVWDGRNFLEQPAEIIKGLLKQGVFQAPTGDWVLIQDAANITSSEFANEIIDFQEHIKHEPKVKTGSFKQWILRILP